MNQKKIVDKQDHSINNKNTLDHLERNEERKQKQNKIFI